MAHAHGIRCLEVVGGKIVCIATQKEVVRRGPHMRDGYAYLYVGSEDSWDRVRLSSSQEDWEDVMRGASTVKGARHLGLVNLDTGFGRRQFNVWKAKDGKFYAQTAHG